MTSASLVWFFAGGARVGQSRLSISVNVRHFSKPNLRYTFPRKFVTFVKADDE